MDKSSAEKQYQKALRLHNAGQVREAELIYRKLLKAFPELDSVWTNLGVTLYQQGRLDDALKAQDRAIAANPLNMDAYTNRAAVLLALGEVDEAAAAYKMLSDADPQNANAHYNYANVLYQAGRNLEAEAAFRKAIAANKDLPQAHYNLGYLFMQQGRLQEAAAAFRKAIAVQPGYAVAYINLANVLADMGEPDQALRHFRLALEIDPGHALARRGLAKVLLGLGRPAEVLAEVEAALEAQPQDAGAWVMKGNALQDLKDYAAAREAYREALRIDPESESARLNLDKAMQGLIPAWHFTMLADDARNAAYRRAIERAVKPGMRVLDIGAGSGLLSLMAVRAGAARVDACEVIPELAETAAEIAGANGYREQIHVHALHSTALELPERADLLVSEILDAGLIGEGVLPSHRHAVAQLLKEGAQVIPARAAVQVQLVSLPQRRKVRPIREVEGFDLSAMARFQGLGQYQSLFLDTEEWQPLSEVAGLWELNLADPGPAATPERPEVSELGLEATAEGVVHAVAFWFELWLDEEERVSTAPGGDLRHWGQAAYYFSEDHAVVPGQEVRLRAYRTDSAWRFEWLGD